MPVKQWSDWDDNDFEFEFPPSTSSAVVSSTARPVPSVDFGPPPEVWINEWYSEELVTLWHLLKDTIDKNGWGILDACDLLAFSEFCYKHSCRDRPPF